MKFTIHHGHMHGVCQRKQRANRQLSERASQTLTPFRCNSVLSQRLEANEGVMTLQVQLQQSKALMAGESSK